MFEKVLEIGMLYDFYGQLLTDKQRDVMQLHYENDYSLTEIGEMLAISRQAVHDAIKKAEKSLREYEEKLKLVERFNETEKKYSQINELVDKVIEDFAGNDTKNKSIKKSLEEIKTRLKEDS